jgi:drug/metabolite transporter (DMT)-like permease
VAQVRGATGDLSLPTLALAAGAIFFRLTGRRAIEPRDRNVLLWLVAGAALFLYPLALGWTPFDPYALGYGSAVFVTALLAVTLAAWHAGLKLPVLVVLAAGLAWLLGVYESRNLWDYLLDPLAAVYALGALLAAGAGKLVSQRRQGAPVV